jgi:hypothetical protein
MGFGNWPSFSALSWQTMHKKIQPQICLAETKSLNKRIFKRTFLLGKKLCSCGFEKLLSSQKYWVRELKICKSQKIVGPQITNPQIATFAEGSLFRQIL